MIPKFNYIKETIVEEFFFYFNLFIYYLHKYIFIYYVFLFCYLNTLSDFFIYLLVLKKICINFNRCSA